MQDSNSKIVAAIIISFTLLQFLILIVFGYTPYPDSNGYLFLAKECIRAGEPYPASSQLYSFPFIWNIGAINLVALSISLFKSILPLLCLYSLLKGLSALARLRNNQASLDRTDSIDCIASLCPLSGQLWRVYLTVIRTALPILYSIGNLLHTQTPWDRRRCIDSYRQLDKTHGNSLSRFCCLLPYLEKETI